MKPVLSLVLLVCSTASIAHEQPESNDSNDSVNTNTAPWSFVPIPELNHELPVKPLFQDPETGASASKALYEAGFINTWHTHNTGHGMYVLDGILKTHKGEFGPGEFVWFPEGERMFHGATEHNDVTFIFITNKQFDIQYENEPPTTPPNE